MHSFQDASREFKLIESILDETSRRSPITFDDSNRLADQQYFIFTGINKQSYNNLYSCIPSASFQQTHLRSLERSVDCLLVKLRLVLSNSVLAMLFSLPHVRAVSRVLESARLSLMEHFVLRYLGFENRSRRDVIDKHTRPLATRVFTNAEEDKAILILDGTYIYV